MIQDTRPSFLLLRGLGFTGLVYLALGVHWRINLLFIPSALLRAGRAREIPSERASAGSHHGPVPPLTGFTVTLSVFYAWDIICSCLIGCSEMSLSWTCCRVSGPLPGF
jgi:hypothetical protein